MYFDEGDTNVIALVEDLLLQSSEVVHDKGLLPRIDKVDAVGCSEQSNAAKCQQLTQFVRHQLYLT